MLIALDIGNSHVRIGINCGDEIQLVASIATEERMTKEQYACQIRDVLQLYNVNMSKIRGAVLCSVVPSVTKSVEDAVFMLTGVKPLNIASGVKTGVQIKTDQPKALGSDIVANAVYAVKNGKLPAVVVDTGTVTTFTVVDKSGSLIGTVISNGIKSSIDNLRQVGVQLPSIKMEVPKKGVIGKNTIDAMKSGTVFGTACMVDGMIERIADELAQKPHIIMCGGSCEFLSQFMKTQTMCDPNVTIKGLVEIWNKNQKG